MDEFDLTPEEEMAFRRLPREAEPSRLLEERVVQSLREEGVLGPGKEARRSGRFASRAQRRGFTVPPWVGVAAAAAALVLFGSGTFLGRSLGARSTREAFMAVREQDASQLALRIQEAGSAYVAALAALSDMRPAGGIGAEAQADRGGDPGYPTGQRGERGGARAARTDLPPMEIGLEQGREVAMGTLYGAAYELARLDPGNADVLRILQILEERRVRERGGPGEARNVIWF